MISMLNRAKTLEVIVSTIRNADAKARLRLRFQDSPSDWQPFPKATATHDAGLVQSYSPKDFTVEIATDGTINVYRRQPPTATHVTTDDERISLGIEDPRPSQLRERLAKINKANTEFYGG